MHEEFIYVSSGYDETQKIAADFAKKLSAGDIITLDGDLGAGKTAFTGGLAKGLGISGHVTSPTFTIVNEYYGDITVYHFDAYRIDADGWINGGFDEYLYNEGICIIEWAENLDGILPEDTYKITITRDLSKGDDYRDIEVVK